ncbi:MAG: sigma-70 family RNA polymerase sigma factor [Pseudomonadales bacterium]
MGGILNKLKSDESLMLAYQRGDSTAFEVLYMRHKDALFGFLYRSCLRHSIAEELAHDAWTSIIRRVASYQATAAFKTYLFQVAHNKLIDYWRRNQNAALSIEFDERILPNNTETPLHCPESQQLRVELRAAIENLPVDQRNTMLLREQGFSQEDIAAITGTERETVKSRLRYATQHLRDNMGVTQ